MDELSLAVVGIDFANNDRARTNRRSELLMTVPGEPIELRPEPTNKHDEHAVAVFSTRGIQVGYLSAERAAWIGRRLRSGEQATVLFQGIAGPVAYVRVRFGGGAPTLPSLAIGQAAGAVRAGGSPLYDPDGFHPDEDGPEWGA